MECEVRKKKSQGGNEKQRENKTKSWGSSHGGVVFMVKPPPRVEVIKKTQSHREWVESEGENEQFIKGRVAEVEEKNHMEGMGGEKKNNVTRNKYKVRNLFFFKSNGSVAPSP